MRGWLGAALVLSVFPMAVEARGLEGIENAAQVGALCAEVAVESPAAREEASARLRHSRFGAGTFTLAEYEAATARLAIDGARGFRARDGSFEMVLHALVGGVPPAGALTMAVPASATEAEDLRRAHARGELELTLWYQVASPPDGGDVCATVRSTRGDGIRIAIEPLAFELSRKGERIASGESARFAALTDPGPVVEPRVVVSRPMLTAENGRAPQAAARAASALEPGLLACYRRGLAGEPALRGSLVAGVELAADGRVKQARAELDALGAPEVTSCVLAAVRTARFPRGSARLSIPIRFTD
jgi:hypothetical protein